MCRHSTMRKMRAAVGVAPRAWDTAAGERRPRSATPAACSACTRPGRPSPTSPTSGLYALQHRGQESAGIAVSDGETITVSRTWASSRRCSTSAASRRSRATSPSATCATRTTGSSSWRNAQPVYRSVGDAGFALGHNGNLTNTAELAEQPRHAARAAARPSTALDSTTDSALVAELIAARVRRRAALRRPRPRAARSSGCSRGSRAASRS